VDILLRVLDDLLIPSYGDPLASIVNSTYPDLLRNMDNQSYFKDRAILAPTNAIVEQINDYILDLMPGDEKTCLSCDSPCSANSAGGGPSDVHTPKFLNTITSSGLPNHVLKLKVGVPVMLLRNIDQNLGLCNGTRLLVTSMGTYVLEARVISGSNIGDKFFIPRLSLTPSDKRIPFSFQRRQFPLVVSFAMTINKSQGQSLGHVGVYLSQPIFSHGQLYVALSRVTSRRGLKILLTDNEGNDINVTSNVVYKEVFQNIQ
jgi:ATP-dependent DNA helicase PIF1